jgi:hypothetical protein
MTTSPTNLSEDDIPELAIEGFRLAFQKARNSGQPVVVADCGVLCEIQPDGSRREIRRLPPHEPG